jgi:hypothetical protein
MEADGSYDEHAHFHFVRVPNNSVQVAFVLIQMSKRILQIKASYFPAKYISPPNNLIYCSRNGMSHTKVQDFLVKIWRIASDDFLVTLTKCSQKFVSTL